MTTNEQSSIGHYWRPANAPRTRYLLASSGGPAAINWQCNSGDKCSAGRAKVKHGCGDFFGPAKPPDWMLRQQGATASVVLADLFGQVRFDDCRANGVHAHAFGRELQRSRFRETNNRELAGTVDWRAGGRPETKYRSIVYYCTSARLENCRDLMLHAEKYAPHVSAKYAVEDFAGVCDARDWTPNKVRAGTDLVDQTGKSLNDIVDSVKKVTDIVAEIAAASQEQSAGIDQVNNAVSQMDEMTQQNAALVEEASAAARAMHEQADELSQQVSFFQINGTTSKAPAKAVATAVAQEAEAVFAAVRKSAPKVAPRPVETADAGAWKEF